MAANPDPIIATLQSGARHELVILAIPSHDRQNAPLGKPRQDMWAHEALKLFSGLFGGATAFETFKGVYRSETGEDLWDNPILIESYTERSNLSSENIRTLREFLRRMKRQLRQEAVLLVVNDYRWFV